MSIVPDPSLTPTAHDLGAAKLLADLQGLVQAVRGYGFISTSHRRRINPSATVPTEFLLAVAVALDASEKLRAMAGITGDQIRDVVAFCNAYGPAVDEVKLKATGVQDSVKTQRANVGEIALRAYRLARDFNTPADSDVLVPHIANMKRALGRGRKKVKPELAPAPAGDPTVAKNA
jgi:hypothetical protein